MKGVDTLIEEEITVSTTSAADFFKKPLGKIRLPPYQRPYVWGDEKIEQLFQDWIEHFFVSIQGKYHFNSNAPLYYMGTALLYKKIDHPHTIESNASVSANDKQTYEIIDGQQRITTLLLLDYKIKKSSSILSDTNWNLVYTSAISSANIKRNLQQFDKQHLFLNIEAHLDEIFEKLIFTIVVTESEDDAFTFFDSQNNRGVSLDPVDFLKSYHLRELKGQEEEQRMFVKNWDSSNAGQFLNFLFEKTLWRARNWKGKSLKFENKERVLDDFQKRTKKRNGVSVKLYSNNSNRFASSFVFSAHEGLKMNIDPVYFQLSPDKFPFTLRQPIEKGVGFFLYTEKYFKTYILLFVEKRIKGISDVTDQLISHYNTYFFDFFRLCLVIYFDKFREEQIFDFMLWMDYLLGAFRVRQSSIVAQTPIKILRDCDRNLLDVIDQAYEPEEIFEFIKSYKSSGLAINTFYEIPLNEYGTENGIRNRYRKAVLSFYDQEIKFDLASKKEWICSRLEN